MNSTTSKNTAKDFIVPMPRDVANTLNIKKNDGINLPEEFAAMLSPMPT